MKIIDGYIRGKAGSLLKPFSQIIIFLILNILFFGNILFFHSGVGFNYFNYEKNAHHFIEDGRVIGKTFSLINSLGQYDAQWYLRIASEGYPKIGVGNDRLVDKMVYAFFPLYPILIGVVNIVFKNIEFTAFFLSIFLILTNYVSLIYIIKKHFNYSTAVKTSFLLFFFPFAVFFRSYFTEGLYLFLLLWFSYFLFERKYLKSSFFLFLLNLTKANGFLLNVLFFYLSLKDFHRGRLKIKELVLTFLLIFVPFAVWMFFNFYTTGNFVYFFKARHLWATNIFVATPFIAFFHNLATIFLFPALPFHTFHYSKVDVLIILGFIVLWLKSKKRISEVYWFISLCLWLSPLLVTDTMSFSRYQSVNFPIFIYLAQVLKGKYYLIMFILFYFILLITSLFFVNWWWVG